MRRCRSCSLGGSPPRAWGQCFRHRVSHRSSRFTPTGVGTMAVAQPQQFLIRGSPPRAWGQCILDDPRRFGQRFTPTGVGTIATRLSQPTTNAVHPHGRGDNERAAARLTVFSWFTPTGVGTMQHPPSEQLSHPVHPHGRGDNCVAVHLRTEEFGSPPRAWGQ